MNMKTLRKLLAAVCATALIVCISVGATIAYLTSQDQVVNTFTVGKVGIELWETDVDENGEVVPNASPVKENDYHLLPGLTYVKDPTVTVKAKSDAAHIRMLVTVSDMAALKNAFPNTKYPDFYNGDLFLLQMLVTGWDENTWLYEGYDNGTYEFRYKEAVSTGDDPLKLDALFDEIKIPETVNNTELEYLQGVKINVVAHAIQKAGFANEDLAWEAFDVQNPQQPQNP